MFESKPLKYKKYHLNKSQNRIYRNIDLNRLSKGNIGLKATSSGKITIKQFIAIRQIINKTIKKIGKFQFKAFPNLPISCRKEVIRMGKGKGKTIYWVCFIKPGLILCEIISPNKEKAIQAFKAAQHRLPITTQIIGI